jgi:hypothetical protein
MVIVAYVFATAVAPLEIVLLVRAPAVQPATLFKVQVNVVAVPPTAGGAIAEPLRRKVAVLLDTPSG